MSEKNASYTLKADSGYQQSSGGRISVDQHAKVVAALEGTDYPKRVRPHIDQFAEHVFVWYDESGLASGASYTLADAEAELLAYGRRLNAEVTTLDFAKLEARVMSAERDNVYRRLLVDTLSMLKDLSLGYDMSGLHRGIDEVLADARYLGIDTEEL